MTDTFLAAAWPALNWILFASLKSVIVIGAVLLCRRAFARRMSAQSLHYLWFAVIASLSIPIGATVNVQFLNRIAVWENSAHVSAPQDLRAQPWRIAQQEDSSAKSPSDAGVARSGLSNAGVLALIWLAGVVALSTAVIWNWVRYRVIRSRARPITDRSTQDQFDRCKRQLCVNGNVVALESPAIDSPALFGVWSPVLLLPQGFSAQMTSTELRHVFFHELTHVRRHDIALNWLAIVVQILHWFNPLVWWTLRRLRVDMERACDATVLEHLSKQERLEYGHTLIRLSDLYPARLALHHGAGMLDPHSQLTSRIHMIAQFGSSKTFHSVFSNALVLALIVMSVTQLSASAQDEPKTNVVTAPNAPTRPALAAVPASPALPNTPATKALPALPAQRALPTVTATPALPALPATPTIPTLAPAEARRMEIIKLRYRKVGLMAELIRPSTGASLLSEDGFIAIDERTNTLVVRDTPERVDDILRTLSALDVPLQQVQIDTRVVLIDQSFLSSAQGKSMLASLTKDGTDATLDQAITELESQRKAELITRPRVITDNGKQALIVHAIDSPQKDQWRSKLNLTILPNIAADNRITVDVSALQETTGMPNGNEIDKRNITTQAAVRDGGVVVLRGLYDLSMQGTKQASNSPPRKSEFVIFLTARRLEQSLALR
jgi:beta-lactamase regulating signal transducer with metallopeptidase domain